MVVGAGEDRVESSVIEEVTKGVDGSVKGRKEQDARVCVTSDGGVRQSSEVSKARGIVDGVVEIPGEGDKEEGGIEGNQGGGDIEALRGGVESSWKVTSKEVI